MNHIVLCYDSMTIVGIKPYFPSPRRSQVVINWGHERTGGGGRIGPKTISVSGVNTKTTADSVLQRAALMVCESRCPANQNQVFSSSVPSSNSPQNIAVPNKTATGYTQGEHFPQVDQRKRFNHQCSTENSEVSDFKDETPIFGGCYWEGCSSLRSKESKIWKP